MGNIGYRADNIKTPPVDKTPPRKKSWILENIKTPEKKFAREAREKFWAFFRLFFKAKWSKNGQSMENIKTPSRTFWEIWKILKPREKKSEISSLRGGLIIILSARYKDVSGDEAVAGLSISRKSFKFYRIPKNKSEIF